MLHVVDTQAHTDESVCIESRSASSHLHLQRHLVNHTHSMLLVYYVLQTSQGTTTVNMRELCDPTGVSERRITGAISDVTSFYYVCGCACVCPRDLAVTEVCDS